MTHRYIRRAPSLVPCAGSAGRGFGLWAGTAISGGVATGLAQALNHLEHLHGAGVLSFALTTARGDTRAKPIDWERLLLPFLHAWPLLL